MQRDDLKTNLSCVIGIEWRDNLKTCSTVHEIGGKGLVAVLFSVVSRCIFLISVHKDANFEHMQAIMHYDGWHFHRLPQVDVITNEQAAVCELCRLRIMTQNLFSPFNHFSNSEPILPMTCFTMKCHQSIVSILFCFGISGSTDVD